MPVELLPIISLQPHPANPRKHFDADYIAELAESMRKDGQWDPIIVRPLPDGQHQIIAGHCRVEAARKLDWPCMRADIRHLDDETADFLALDTNLKRKSLSEIEEAEAIRRMRDRHGWTQEQIAKRFSKTQFWVSYRLNLLKAHPEVQQAVIERSINATQAAEIAKAPTELQPVLASKVKQADLTTRATEALVKVATDPGTPEDVKKALLQGSRMTPEHAAAIARVPSREDRRHLVNDVEAGRMTPEEVAKEADVAVRMAEAPKTLTGERARRLVNVNGTLVKIMDQLEAIDGDEVAGLDEDGLRTVDATLAKLKVRLDRLSRWVTAAQGNKQQGKGAARVHEFRPRS